MSFCFFFKQMTAYEMLISYWSSDVCSSGLLSDSTIIPIPGWQPASKARVSGLPARLSASIHHAGSARDGRTPPPLDAGHGATPETPVIRTKPATFDSDNSGVDR